MEAKFSNRVKEVISLSREEALRLGHDYIGTEHLLLGMIREGEGVAVGLLKKLGIPLDELRGAIEKVSKGTATHDVKKPQSKTEAIKTGLEGNRGGITAINGHAECFNCFYVLQDAATSIEKILHYRERVKVTSH